MKIRFTHFASFLAALSATISLNVLAASDCPQFSPGGQAPIIANAKMRVSTQQLCYSDFAVLHSGVTHGPLWSAEHLTAQHIDDARDNTRTNRFLSIRNCRPATAPRSRTTRKAATIAATSNSRPKIYSIKNRHTFS